MKIAVPVKFVPDLVEELAIDPSGTALDTTWLRLIINEFDDHAVEQAILLKEHSGGSGDGHDHRMPRGWMIFCSLLPPRALINLIKLTGDFSKVNNHALARAYADLLKGLQPDLMLTGVQAT